MSKKVAGGKRKAPVTVLDVPRSEFEALRKLELQTRFKATFAMSHRLGWIHKERHVDSVAEPYFVNSRLGLDTVYGKEAFLARYGIVLASASAHSPRKLDAEENAKRRRSTGTTPIAVPIQDPRSISIDAAFAKAWPELQKEGWRQQGLGFVNEHLPNIHVDSAYSLLEAYAIINYDPVIIEPAPAPGTPLSEEAYEKQFRLHVDSKFKDFWQGKKVLFSLCPSLPPIPNDTRARVLT